MPSVDLWPLHTCTSSDTSWVQLMLTVACLGCGREVGSTFENNPLLGFVLVTGLGLGWGVHWG